MSKVFLSHSSKDRTFTGRLAQDLSSAGVPVWYDAWEIRVGDSISERIDAGLTECDYLVVILSKASSASKWVREELSAAKTIEIGKRGVFILPVLIEDCPIPPLIASKRYADFRTDYTRGFKELLGVFGRTHANESDAPRYLKLEREWKAETRLVEKELRQIIRLRPGAEENEFYLSEDYSDENLAKLRERIADVLDIYRALRPLEKSQHLLSYIDGTALSLAIMGKADDLQLEILQNSYPSMTGVGVGVYLSVGIAQATCDLFDESIWTLRKAIRIALHIEERWEDALLALTYQLSRYISYLHVAPEQDFAVNLLLNGGEYLETRYRKSMAAYRSALEMELNWDIDGRPDDRVNYCNLLDAVGFFREESMYIDIVRKDFPDHEEFAERAALIREYIKPMNTKGDHKMQLSGIRRMPPFFAEFGQRYRFDDMIEKMEGDFWKEVVLGLDTIIDEEMVKHLFPGG